MMLSVEVINNQLCVNIEELFTLFMLLLANGIFRFMSITDMCFG
jgi:hypothetical protein